MSAHRHRNPRRTEDSTPAAGLPPAGVKSSSGKNVAERYPGAQIGNKLQFGKGDWEIVGVMSQGSSAINSELWVT